MISLFFSSQVFHIDEYEFIHELFIRLSQEKVRTKKKEKHDFYFQLFI